jgi:hypothetical protein
VFEEVEDVMWGEEAEGKPEKRQQFNDIWNLFYLYYGTRQLDEKHI